jgi:hypothetical protein
MRFTLVVLFISLILGLSAAWVQQSGKIMKSTKISMSSAPTTSDVQKNMSRTLRRKIRSLNSSNFDTIYDPKVEGKSMFYSRNRTHNFIAFLKTGASDNVSKIFLKKIKQAAFRAKVTLRPDFGVRPKPVFPDLVETAIAAGNFAVCLKPFFLSSYQSKIMSFLIIK